MNLVDPLFPVGKTRLETVGVVGCAVIMSVATLEVCGCCAVLRAASSPSLPLAFSITCAGAQHQGFLLIWTAHSAV